MKQTMTQAGKQSDSLWSGGIPQHAAVHPLLKHEPPLIACTQTPPRLQAKLKIGKPNDQYEQEANRIADQVMRMPDPQMQRKRCSPYTKEDEEKIIQTKSARNNSVPHSIDHPLIQNVVSSLGQPLDATTRSFMEPRFGKDFSQVRLHTNKQAAESDRMMNARAYTTGRNVVFGQGQYMPLTNEGRKLLAHELVHVLQQSSIPQKQLHLETEQYETRFHFESNNCQTNQPQGQKWWKSMNQPMHISKNEMVQADPIPYEGPPVCNYETGEVQESKNNRGKSENINTNDRRLLKWLFWNYEVGKYDLKNMHRKMATYFVTNLNLNQKNSQWKVIEINGYTDCSGIEATNRPLRRLRAEEMLNIFHLFGALKNNIPSTVSSGYSVGPWGSSKTKEGRARNRSVLVTFEQKISKDPEIEPNPPKRPPSNPHSSTPSCGLYTDIYSEYWTLKTIAGRVSSVGRGSVEMIFILKNRRSGCFYDAKFQGTVTEGSAIGGDLSILPIPEIFEVTPAKLPAHMSGSPAKLRSQGGSASFIGCSLACLWPANGNRDWVFVGGVSLSVGAPLNIFFAEGNFKIIGVRPDVPKPDYPPGTSSSSPWCSK